MNERCKAKRFIPAGVHVSPMHLSCNETHHVCERDADHPCQSHRCRCDISFDDPLTEEIADTLWQIEGNYNREGSGPGSRFEGQRLEMVQARTVIRRVLRSVTK